MNILQMMKQAQELQSKMREMQAEVGAIEVEGEAGGGAVKVRLNGKGEMLGLTIEPSLLKPDDVAILEDLIITAHRSAKARAEAMLQDKMNNLTAGLPIPSGLKLF
jgi:hypothetical protein